MKTGTGLFRVFFGRLLGVNTARKASWWLVGFSFISCIGLAAATTLPEVQRGLDWLQTYVESVGVNAPSSKVATGSQTQCEIAQTLVKLSASNPRLNALVSDLANVANVDQATEIQGCLESLQQKLGISSAGSAVASRRGSDGGYSAFAGGRLSSTLDTGAVLDSQLQKLSASELSAVLGFLRSRQSANGSFETPRGGTLLTSAVVLRGLKRLVTQNPTAASLAQATSEFLLAQQSPDGAWSNDIALSALVYEAVFPYTNNKPEVTAKLKSFLLTNQATDGSWMQDAYVTAVALRALQMTGETPTNPLVSVLSGTVSGQVRHGVTQEPLPNATITLQLQALSSQTTPTMTLSLATNSAGRYTLTGVVPGFYLTSANLAGFMAQTATFELQANGGIVYSPSLYPVGQSPSPGIRLQARILDSVSGLSLPQATVFVRSVTNTQTITASASGEISAQLAISGALTLTYASPGYLETRQTGFFPEGSFSNLGDIKLQTKPTVTNLSGRVLGTEGDIIQGAQVWVVETGASAISNAQGTYALSGITLRSFTVRVSAPGRVTRSNVVTAEEFGNIQADFILPIADSAKPKLSLSDMTLAPSRTGANSLVTVTVNVNNPSGEALSVESLLTVLDSDGAIISTVPVTRISGAGWINNKLQPGLAAQLVFVWNTGVFPAGTYKAQALLVEPGSRSAELPFGTKVDELSSVVAVTETPIFSGSIQASPPVVRAGINATVRWNGLIQNTGNTPLPSQSYQLRVINSQSGVTVLTRQASAADILLGRLSKLEFDAWENPPAGSYKLEVFAVGIPGSVVSGNLLVGDSATATFTVNKNVVPTGNSAVRGQITVTGADVATGISSDPLAPLVKAAVIKAVNYGDDFSYRHHVNDLKCFACHVQSQAVVGGERNLRFAPSLNPLQRSALADNMARLVTSQGYIPHVDGSLRVTNTTLGLWALSEWSKPAEVSNTNRSMADYLMTRQEANGSWPVDHVESWWRTKAPFVALNVGSLTKLKETVAKGTTFTSATTSAIPMQAIPSGSITIIPDRSGGFYASNYTSDQLWHIPKTGPRALISAGQKIGSIVEMADGRLILGSYTQGILIRETSGSITQVINTPVWDVAALNGEEFVATANNNGFTIYKFKLSGELSTFYSSTQFSAPARGLTVTRDGDVLTNSYYGGQTLRISGNGVLKDIPIPISGSSAYGLQAFPDGTLLRTNTDGMDNGIHLYSPNYVSERLAGGAVFHAARLTDGRIVATINGSLVEVGRAAIDTAQLVARIDRALDLASPWLISGSQVSGNNNIDVAFRLMGLNDVKKKYIGTSSESQIQTLMEQLGDTLWARQRSDGGWVWQEGIHSISDSMVTAMVGLALDTLNPSKDDPKYRKIVELLLARQQGDGTWITENSVSSQSVRQIPTTWVEIFLPTLLDRLGGIDSTVNVDFPANVVMSNPSISPTSVVTSGGVQRVEWQLQGVTAQSRSFEFDLALSDMQIDETRSAASTATLSFRNSFEPGTVTVAIPIPSVYASASTTVSVSANKPSYNESEVAVFSAPVTNASGAVRDVQVRMSVLDASGQLVEVLPLGSPLTIAAGASVPAVQQWSVAGVLSGNYQVLAELISPQGIVYGSATASFVVQASQSILNGARVSADRVNYSAAQSVQLASRVTNASSNAVQDNVRALTEVFSSAGQSIFTQSEPIAQLTPNGQRSYNYSLVAGSLQPGNYQARIQLLSAQGSVLAQSSTSFVVQDTSQTGIGLRGQLQANPSVALIGQSVSLNLQVNNNGNTALSNLPVTIRVLDPQSGNVLATYTQTLTSLTAGQSLPFNATWTSAGLDGQILIAAATANLNGRDIALAQAQIRLQGIAQLAASPSQLNFGTATLSSSGQVSPTVASQLITVRSIGSAPVQSLSFAINGLDANAFVIQGGTCTSGMALAINASCTLSLGYQPTISKTHQANLSVGHAAAGNILESVSLQGQAIQTQIITLESLPIAVKDARILVLASCAQSSNSSNGHHEEHDDDDDDDRRTSRGNNCSPQPQQNSCVSERSQAISQYLSGLGILNKVVTDEASFRHEMRCGGYNTYWISGGASKLDHYLVKEVREAVWRGDGLIIDGQHDDRNLLLDATAGVKYRGKLPGTNYSASIPLGSVFAQGGAASTIATLGQPAKYDLLTGQGQGQNQVQARFTANHHHVPAIVSNRYGAGQAMLFAFDLAGMVTQDVQQTATINLPLQHIVSTTAGQVGGNAVSQTASKTLTAGDIQAQGLNLSNPSDQTVTAQVTLNLPPQLSYSSASRMPSSVIPSSGTGTGTATTSAQVSWLITLAPQQSQQLIWRVKVQTVASASATYAMPVQVFSLGQGAGAGSSSPSSTQLQATHSFTIHAVSGSGLIAQALPAVQALAPAPSSERNAKARAINAIHSATSLHNQGRYNDAIIKWIDAANDLISMTSLSGPSASSATQAAHTAARRAVAFALEASTDGQCQALMCLRGDLSFGSAAPLLGGNLNISRAVTNSCPAPLHDIPVTATLTNRRTQQSVLSLSDSRLDINVGQTNTRNATWSVSGSQQGGQNQAGDTIVGILSAEWQGHRIELDQVTAQITAPAIPACPAGGTVATSRFTPFSETERLEVRGGRPGSADWEWGLGANTQAAGQFTQANLDWLSGINYHWTLVTDAQGKGVFTVRNGSNIVAQGHYDKPSAKLRSGNAIRLNVKTSSDAGSAKISATLVNIEGASVNHSVTTTAANQSNSIVITHPGLANGMTAEGTLRLNFTGSAPPQGSRLNMTVTAGQVQCP